MKIVLSAIRIDYEKHSQAFANHPAVKKHGPFTHNKQTHATYNDANKHPAGIQLSHHARNSKQGITHTVSVNSSHGIVHHRDVDLNKAIHGAFAKHNAKVGKEMDAVKQHYHKLKKSRL